MNKKKIFITFIIIIIIFLIIFCIIAPKIFDNIYENIDDYDYQNGMMGNYKMMMGYGLMGFWMLIPTILLILLLYTIYKLNDRKDNHNEALNILKQRYAKGEISLEEYNQMKRNINS